MSHVRYDFENASRLEVANKQLRSNLRHVLTGLMLKRAAQFPDPVEEDALRSRGEAIRQRALAQLPDLLEQFEKNLTANGIQVHWARDGEEARTIILEILKRKGAKTMIKGKSMASEEIHLNKFLGEHGIEAIESDLGEYILQIAGETPSHIVMPALHKNINEIGTLFEEKIKGQPYSENADELTAAARRVLRQRFLRADVGFSGVNFGVAETGSLVLISNEGNGRMSTHTPDTHIALMGVEKVIERFDEVGTLAQLACRSATGQPITTYLNVISGPRRAGEKDGPEEVHLVLMDNGRTQIYQDEQMQDSLRCIRCASCMNHCPVYTRVGGHAFVHTYPGPIGEVLNPQMLGIDIAGDAVEGCTLCGRCAEVCPVKIPLPDLILRLRRESIRPTPNFVIRGAGSRSSTVADMVWGGWKVVFSTPALLHLSNWMLRKVGNFLPKWAPGMRQWTLAREKPRFASKSIHELAREKGLIDD